MSNLRMYIAVHENAPDHMTPTLVAHSVLGAHLRFIDNAYCNIYNDWLNNSFKKIVVKVNKKEFAKIQDLEFKGYSVYAGYENTIMNAEPSCLVVIENVTNICNVLKFAKLWKPECLK